MVGFSAGPCTCGATSGRVTGSGTHFTAYRQLYNTASTSEETSRGLLVVGDNASDMTGPGIENPKLPRTACDIVITSPNGLSEIVIMSFQAYIEVLKSFKKVLLLDIISSSTFEIKTNRRKR